MQYEIVELEIFSGRAAKVYSIIPEGMSKTLFDIFIEENKTIFKDELKDIASRLYNIGNKTGARASFFKEHEGIPGDFVCALYDTPDKHLRLYCIRFGTIAIILGGGGEKRKNIRAWQDDPKLSKEANVMMAYAQDILKRIDDGNIYWSDDNTQLEGNLKNYDDEQNT